MNYLATSCGDQNLPREIQVSIPPLSCYRARMFTIFYSSSFFYIKKKDYLIVSKTREYVFTLPTHLY